MTSDENPKPSVQSIVYIAIAVLCILYFIWSGISAPANPNYQDSKPTVPATK
jgi:hypothetical protein